MISFGSKNKNIIFNKTFTLENIESIDIMQTAGDILFKENSSDNLEVVIYGDNANEVEASMNNNKLSIDHRQKHRFILFGLGNIKNDIIVYIPSSYKNSIKIRNDFGNFEMDNFETASIDVDCNAGNVEVGKVKNANIQCDLGKVEISEVLNKCNVEVDSGNVKIDKLSIQENSFIRADLGNVTIGEVNDIYVDAKVDLGNSTVNGSNRSSNITLKIECDCGNISVGK